jgi:hypothetical protein
MAKTSYLPTTEADKLLWLNNFAAKFSTHAVSLGFVAADATAITNDAAMFAYLTNLVETFTTAKEQRVQYKNLIKDGPIGMVAGALPAIPVVPAAPAAVAPGIFPRIAQVVQRIKSHPGYTEAIGKDLGIIGAEKKMDFGVMKPVIKLVLKGGQVEVQWAKGDADSIRIEVDRGSGSWQFLSIDSVPHYTDTTPVTAANTWKYRAIYIVSDEPVGQWSDVVGIVVG